MIANTLSRVLVSTALVAAAVTAADAAEAQAPMRVGIGYVVNAPEQLGGVGAHVLVDALGGIGLYVDYKQSIDSPESEENFEAEWSATYVDDTFGDDEFGGDEIYRTINVALMRPLTPELVAYAGGGVVRRRSFVEYYDGMGERGQGGFYWVEDEAGEDTGLNFLGGAFFRIGSHMSLQFGIESAPKGLTVGAHYALPIGG